MEKQDEIGGDTARIGAILADDQEDQEMLAEMHRLGELRWKMWKDYAGKETHPGIAAWRGGFRAAWSACMAAMATRHGILIEEDAERFLERMENSEPIDPATIVRMKADYERFNAMLKSRAKASEQQ